MMRLIKEERLDDCITAGSRYYVIPKYRMLMEFNYYDKLSIADILKRPTTPNNWGYDEVKHTLEGIIKEGLLKRYYEQYIRV